jgi:hypothetical protein
MKSVTLQETSKLIDNNKLDDIYFKYNPSRYKTGYRPHQYIRIHLLFHLGFFKSFNALHDSLKNQKELRKFCCLKNNEVPAASKWSEFRNGSNVVFLDEIMRELLEVLEKIGAFSEEVIVLIPDSTDIEANCNGFGKKICQCKNKKCKCQRQYTAKGASKCGRTKKSGKTQTFVGWRKHTIWTVLRKYSKVIPLASTTQTATYSDNKGYLNNINPVRDLFPAKTLISVADMGYIDSETKNISRTKFDIPLITSIKKNMIIDENLFDPDGTPTCSEGYRLLHDEYDKKLQTHYYVANRDNCNACPFNATCEKEFSLSSKIHETLLNPIPLHTKLNKKLRKQIRPQCESGNFLDKHVYNINNLFKNNGKLVSFVNKTVDIAHLLDVIVFIKKSENKKPRKTVDSVQLKLNLAA